MKLSEYTLSVLKNFSTINSGIVLASGKIQRTISPEQTILVEAELDDEFPIQFGIYDLNLFLGNISMLDNPELVFSDDQVSMSDSTFKLSYKPCRPELIICPPKKTLELTDVDVKFEMSNNVLSKILRLASINTLPSLSVVAKNGSLSLKAHDASNSSANNVESKIDDWSGNDFFATFKAVNLKIVPDDYIVELKERKFAKITSKTRKLTYFIALENK